MHRALELATNGLGSVSPNPMVGCVIVKNNKIIGEGFHQVYGGQHAEVNAISAVQNLEDFFGADLYVTLEPCAHFGKTPPCADLLAGFKFKKIFVCNSDPNPVVSGKGIVILQKNGLKVETGMLEESGRFLNRRFFTYIEKSRPYVILKWAQTADGFIARKDKSSKWISNAFSRRLVHKWRSEEVAVMIGGNTLLYDNPKLNTRDWQGKDPIRVAIDFKNVNTNTYHFFDKSQRTIVFNASREGHDENIEYIIVNKHGAMINDILHHLYKRNIQSLMVEGGTQLLNLFISTNLWDEARVFKSTMRFEQGIAAPEMVLPNSSDYIFDNELFYYYNHTTC